ncbi:MAG: hypothetical protein QM791_20335 [Ferruginibacter sp.]
MEFIFVLPLLAIPFAFPFMAGTMARNFGRSYRFWFWLSVPLPLVAHFILLCLPDRSKQLTGEQPA